MAAPGYLTFFILVLISVDKIAALTPSHYLTLHDVQRLQNSLDRPFTDLEGSYYTIVGLNQLGGKVADEKVRIYLWDIQNIDEFMMNELIICT
ncbi:PREDICTED: dolichyl-diphosphooligosaccharide--protein glycosyltransferase subunit 2-like [Thamnophis sirtalis]|uniref:Dolichyl-diphosphooligosaccharide--protein glycosyltransferase subunit 2-like n=1 Tax=Thamnophis sirtalis TaxID=35019 RepID=A0A6I9YMB7_9SAUR|nr:PREDICTED: dolichyl-diphosphooligosaccharide--protein glycosyltransferase subunit 2-like [Thamnophis sirtalis]